MSRKSIQKHRNDPVAVDQPTRRIVSAQVSTFSGPLPHPAQLAQYEQVQPGFAQAILTMAQKDQEHQHQMELRNQETERAIVQSHMKYFGRGQIIAGGIAIIGIAGAVVASVFGSPGAGIGIVSAVMVPLGAAFALGKWHDKNG